MGYNCDFNKEIKPFRHNFYDEYLPSYYTRNKGSLTESKIKSDIANGQIFGVVEVDISVKDEFKDFVFQNFHTSFAPVGYQCQI